MKEIYADINDLRTQLKLDISMQSELMETRDLSYLIPWSG